MTWDEVTTCGQLALLDAHLKAKPIYKINNLELDHETCQSLTPYSSQYLDDHT